MSSWAPSPNRPCQRCAQYLNDVTANCQILTFRQGARRCWRCAKSHHNCIETPPSAHLAAALRARDKKEQADVDLLLESTPANIKKSKKELKHLNKAVVSLVDHLASERSRQSAATKRLQPKASTTNASTRETSSDSTSSSIESSLMISSGSESPTAEIAEVKDEPVDAEMQQIPKSRKRKLQAT